MVESDAPMFSEPPSSRFVALVADASGPNQELARRTLEAHHMAHVVEASTGKAALDLVTTLRFDIVVMNAALPLVSGLDVLCAMRDANQTGPRTPVVLVTDADWTDKRLAPALSDRGCIVIRKSDDPDLLEHAVAALLARPACV